MINYLTRQTNPEKNDILKGYYSKYQLLEKRDIGGGQYIYIFYKNVT